MAQSSPEWVRRLDPSMFQGTTRQIILAAQEEDEDMLEEAARVGPRPRDPVRGGISRVMDEEAGLAQPPAPPPQPQRAMPEQPQRLMPDHEAVIEPAIGAPPPTGAPQAGGMAPQAPQNLRQAFGPYVGGPGGSFVDMARQHRQTGAMPDMSGMMQPPGQAPMQGGGMPQPTGGMPQPAAAGGGGLFGGGMGDRGRYMMGGLGAILREMGGSQGALENHMNRHQASMQQAQELGRFNKTVDSALQMGIDPEYVMMLAQTGDMKTLVKAIGEERKFTREIDKPTAAQRDYRLYREQGGQLPFFEFSKEHKRAEAPSINIDQRGETKFAEELGRLDAQRVDDVSEKAGVAHNKLVEIERMKIALESGRFTPGAFGHGRHFISQMAELVGISSDDIWEGLGDPAVADTLDAASMKLAAEAAKDLGRITNMSLGFIRDSLPALTRTRAGNEIIIEVMQRAAQREIEIAQLADEYVNTYGTLRPKDAPSFFEARNRLEKQDPIISEELKRRIEQGSRSAPQSWKDVLGGDREELGALPNEAVEMLRSDPSPEAMQEFDEIFGPGAAQRVLGAQ
jgi:hypothetical protein